MSTPETKTTETKTDNKINSDKVDDLSTQKKRGDNLIREMRSLIKQLKATMESHQSIRFNKAPNPIDVSLNKYSKAFEKTVDDIEDHVKPFAKFYLNNRESILSHSDDKWLEEGKLII